MILLTKGFLFALICLLRTIVVLFCSYLLMLTLYWDDIALIWICVWSIRKLMLVMLVRGVLFVLTPYVSWEFAQRWPGESALYGAPGGEVVRLAGLRQCKAFNGCNNFFLLSPTRGRQLVPQGYLGGRIFFF